MPSKIKVSYSESDAYRQCRLKWHLGYAERWRTADTPAALARGTAFHAAMEFHYAVLQARDPLEMPSAELCGRIHTAMVDGGLIEGEVDPVVDWMVQGYQEFYGADEAWEILAVEVDFEIPIFDHTGAESEFYLMGRIDLIVRNRGTGKIFVVDHKTCSSLPTDKALDFDEQMALYTIAGRRMGYDIHGAVYNAVKSKQLVRAMVPSERFLRKYITKTDFELQTVEHELVETMREAHRPREIDPPRSPDSNTCNWKCNFREACLAGRKSGPVRMREFLRDTGFRQPESVPPYFAEPTPPESPQMDLLNELARVA